MRYQFLRYPGGLGKAVTLSYDDGCRHDVRFSETITRAGLKCTFNATLISQLNADEMKENFLDRGHEIAVHSYSHPHLEELPPAEAAYEILEDRKCLEEQFGGIIRGMAYPYGTYNDTVVEILKNSGILYARTVVSTKKFDIPTDWLRLPATCHHNSSDLMPLAEKFVKYDREKPALFYLWGHSYEFDDNDNWDVIENFCEYIGGKDDVWYATNIEIFEYMEAYNRLIWGIDAKTVKNPSSTDVWISISRNREPSQLVEIKAGATVTIN